MKEFKVYLRSIAVMRTNAVVRAESEDAAWEKVKEGGGGDLLWEYDRLVEGELECERIEGVE